MALVRTAARSFAVWTKAIPANLQSVSSSRGGWFPIVHESWAGAWQANVTVSLENVLSHPTVFACVTLIAFDVAKLRVRLVQQQDGDIWTELESPAFSPVLRKPNRWQNRIQFFQTWMLSKLIHGNSYVLKQRDQRGLVVALYVLDPNRVRPLVAESGDVYYELQKDVISEQPKERLVVPASEVIHDLYVALYHPLVGVGPLHASGVAATQSLHIQSNSANFHANGATPGGILFAPEGITDTVATELKEAWETNYGGENAGKIAVLGGNLKYEPLKMMSAVDAQVVDQLKWDDEKICSAFHVPGYKVGVGTPPPYNTVVQRNQEYYSDCIQVQLENIELLLDEGLGLAPDKIEGKRLGTEFDLEGLVRMDTAAQITAEAAAVGAGIRSPNEARARLNQKPVPGGETPYLQQQYWPLSQLSTREIPAVPAGPTPQPPDDAPDDENEKHVTRALLFHKAQQRLRAA